MKLTLIVAALCAACSGACCAQSYSRSVNSGVPYVERTGPSQGVCLQSGDLLQVKLPFDFPYYDRTYSACWMTVAGGIAFHNGGVSLPVSDLIAPFDAFDVAVAHVFKADLICQYSVQPQSLGVFFEPGRVVFQWRRVSFDALHPVWLNFQAHLFDDGEIRFQWGADTADAVYNGSFVSGLVPPTGTSSVPGFGGTLALQTSRPPQGLEVVFRPSGFVQANGIELAPMSDALCRARTYSGVTTGNLVSAFVLKARGNGGVVSRIDHNMDYWVGLGLSLRLYRDEAPLGEFNATSDTPLKAVIPGAFTQSFDGLGEPIDAANPERGYFIAVDVLLPPPTPWFVHTTINASFGAVSATAVVWGGFGSEYPPMAPSHIFVKGPFVNLIGAFCLGQADYTPMYSGSTNNTLAAFSIRRDLVDLPAQVNQLGWDYEITGLPLSSITDFRLWRDRGVLGASDSNDVLIGEILNPVSPNLVFSGLAEQALPADTHYLLTCSISSTNTDSGEVFAFFSQSDWQSATPGVTLLGGANTSRRIAVTTAKSVLCARADKTRNYAQLPAQPGERYVPALALMLESSFGVCTVSQLTLSRAGNGSPTLTVAQLYIDNGSLPGRRDPLDMLVASGVVSATNAVFTGLSLVIAQSVPLLVTVDVGPSSSTGQAQFTLVGSAILQTGAGSTQLSEPIMSGPAIDIEAGAASNGVDVTTEFNSNSFTLVDFDWTVVAHVAVTGRGAGGQAPAMIYKQIDGFGAASYSSVEILVVRDFGTIGQWDGPDQIVLQDWQGLFAAFPLTNSTVTARRDFLICMRRSGLDTGVVRFRPGGLLGGDNVIWTQNERQEPITLTLTVSAAPPGGGGIPGSGGKSGSSSEEASSCSTSESANWCLLLGALAALTLAARLRRKATLG